MITLSWYQYKMICYSSSKETGPTYQRYDSSINVNFHPPSTLSIHYFLPSSLRCITSFADPFMLPWLQVDRGAIKFILSGANIMCPGLTSKGAKMETVLPEDTIVVSFTDNFLWGWDSKIPVYIITIYIYKCKNYALLGIEG